MLQQQSFLPTDRARDLDASYRSLAAGVVRRAVEDLAVARQRAHARAFLQHTFWQSLWRDLVGPEVVTPTMMAQAIRSGVRRRVSHARPRPSHRAAAEPDRPDEDEHA